MPNDPVFAAKEMARLASSRRTSFDDAWFMRAGLMRTPEQIIEVLDAHLTDARTERIEAALDGRTRNLVVVVEGMVDTGNIAAVMRTSDGFGVQEVHTIDTAGSYKHSKRTSQGAEKWLDRFRWRSVDDCVAALRRSGRRVASLPVRERLDGWVDSFQFSLKAKM